MIEFGEFAPDRSVFDPSACNTIENVLPRSKSWSPFPSYQAFTQPLDERPQGAILANFENGQYFVFVGSKTRLWRFNSNDLGWDDVSGASAPFNAPDAACWSMRQFGDWVIASNGVDDVQYFDIRTSTAFQPLSPDAPKALFTGVIGDFVMLLNLQESNTRIQWSGLNSPQFWTPREQSSDFQQFPDGGEIMGYSGYERGCVIFHENCIREGALALDTSLIMTFQKTVENHGVAAPKSIIPTGNGIFYLSQDGFYQYGSPPRAIGNERVDDFFINDVATDGLYGVYGSEDHTRKVVYWAYRSRENTIPHSYDKVLAYSYGVDKWSLLKPGTYLTGLIEAATPGYTLDSLDLLGIPLDELPYSLDSRAWAGGFPTLAAFDVNNRLGFFSGSPLEAIIQTGSVGLSSKSRTFVNGFRVLSDAMETRGRVAVRDRSGAHDTWKVEAHCNRTGLIPTRASGRFHRFEVKIPAGQEWSHVHGVEPVGKAEGQQ